MTVDSILASAPELLAYERWLEAERRRPDGPRDYLFAEDLPRFEPRKDDVALALPGLTVSDQGGMALLSCAQPPLRLPLPGVSHRAAERVLAAIDGERCLLEVRLDSGVDAAELAGVLRGAFGVAIFAPEAVTRLESQLSGASIVRFPSAPYAVERPYWENMIAVRERIPERLPASTEDFVHLLRELHVVALMGDSLTSFYKPASPVTDREVWPGALYTAPARTLETARGTLYLDGPRVNVSFVGGEAYHRALHASVGDEEAGADARRFSVSGLDWGRFVTARSERETDPKPWFVPPRPMRAEHFEQLRVDLDRALSSADLSAAARFHQGFVRLHPFYCANQSVAMSLVNAALERRHGAGIPHFILDHLALRLGERAYEDIFHRAVRALSIGEPDAARRWALLRDRMRRALSCVRDPAVRDPEAAGWALLTDAA